MVANDWIEAETDLQARENDLGALILDCSIGDRTGWFGLGSTHQLEAGEKTVVIGYAADRPPVDSQWMSLDELRLVRDRTVFYQNDTFGGTAGAPLTLESDPNTIVAVHTSGLSGEPPWSENNSGTRITTITTAIIEGWLEEASRLAGEQVSQSGSDYQTRAADEWERIKDGQSASDFSSFLLRYPKSRYSELAASAISEIAGVAFIREKIDGSNIEGIALYGEGSELRKLTAAVGLLRISFFAVDRELTCTAFLVGPYYILTSLSCLQGAGESPATAGTLIMNKIYAMPGNAEEEYDVDVTPLESDNELGYAILRVHGNPSETWGSLPLAAIDPVPGEPLTMVHHPGGIEQFVTRGRCRAALVQPEADTFLHTCDTLIGSAGAPIWAEGGAGGVLGLHLSGFEPLGNSDVPNSAARMRAILARSDILQPYVSGSTGRAPSGELAEDPEDLVWRIINAGQDVAQFLSYLRDYPDGKYREMAEQRIKDLVVLNARLEPSDSSLGESASPRDVEDSVVFIECAAGDDKRSGTGVVVGRGGSILTALHIAPDAKYECWAALGSSAIRPDRKMERRKVYADADLVMFQLIEPFENTVAVKYTELSEQDQLGEAVSWGFPQFGGRIKARLGRISDTFPSGIGYIEIEGLRLTGMDGAPVFLGRDGPLIGLVVGEGFDNEGRALELRVLSAGVLAREFPLDGGS